MDASLIDSANFGWLRAALDADHDGLWDPPAACALGGYDAMANSLNDPDGDGRLDTLDSPLGDNAPGVYNPCQFDRDGDDVGDAADTCIDHPNPGAEQELDTDMDGVPDACDNCRLIFNPGQEDGDIFVMEEPVVAGDRVGDACDNCPLIVNSDQANCNLDAEFERGLIDLPAGLTGIGDACDPTPCPNARFVSEDGLDTSGGLRVRTTAEDLLRVDALSTTPQRARTGFRFCPCSAATSNDLDTRQRCKRLQFDGTGGCALDQRGDDLYRRPTEPQSWRFMDLVHPSRSELSGTGLRQEVALDYAPASGHFETDLLSRWQQLVDEARWQAQPWGWSWPRDVGTGQRADLRGVLWSHAPGPAGGPDFPLALRLLTSHYESGPVAPPREARAPFECHQFLGPYVGRPAFCPLCGSSFPLPFVGLPGRLGGGLCNLEPLPPVIVLPFDELPGEAGFGPDPGPLLDVAGTWVAAAESDAWLPKAGPRYAALSTDGSALLRVLVETDTAFAEPMQQPPDTCDNPNGCQEPFTASALSADLLAPPCVGAAMALSSREHTLYRVGGQDAAGQPTGGLWAFDTQTSAARPLPIIGQRPGAVLAATYDAASRRLLWLDVIDVPVPMDRGRHEEREHGRADEHGRHEGPRLRTEPVVRLVATGPFGGELVELGRWPRLSPNTRFAMATDPQGRLFLAASPEGHGAHVVLHLELGHEGVRLDGFALGPGFLAATQIRASERGVSLVARHGRRERLVGYATEDLRDGSSSRALFRRCF